MFFVSFGTHGFRYKTLKLLVHLFKLKICAEDLLKINNTISRMSFILYQSEISNTCECLIYQVYQ